MSHGLEIKTAAVGMVSVLSEKLDFIEVIFFFFWTYSNFLNCHCKTALKKLEAFKDYLPKIN